MFDRAMYSVGFSWLPSQFASQSDAPVGAPRQFGPPNTCPPRP